MPVQPHYLNERSSIDHDRSQRYIIIAESLSGSRFANYSIVDTSFGMKNNKWKKVLCECSCLRDAYAVYTAIKPFSKSHSKFATQNQLRETPKVKDILKAVEVAHNLPFESFCVPTRKRQFVQARQHAMKLLCENTPYTLNEIGRILSPKGKYDHSTVIHGRKTWEDLSSVDRKVKQFNEIADKVLAR